MNTSTSPAERLASRRPLFWDISPERISTALRDNDDWAIVRIFEYGTLDDIEDCIAMYGAEKVSKVLTSSRLQPTAYVMGYLFLDLDPEGRYL